MTDERRPQCRSLTGKGQLPVKDDEMAERQLQCRGLTEKGQLPVKDDEMAERQLQRRTLTKESRVAAHGVETGKGRSAFNPPAEEKQPQGNVVLTEEKWPSQRLKMIGSLVPEGARIADIGTDHAYLPIVLASSGKIPCALAMDIRKGPLEGAKTHIRAAGLSGQIAVRQSDGLQGLREGEADTLVISGMGGKLMIRILSDGRKLLPGMRRLVLSPQSDIPAVREFLSRIGFRIMDEDMVLEDGKFYTAIAAEPESDQENSADTENASGRKPENYFPSGEQDAGSPFLTGPAEQRAGGERQDTGKESRNTGMERTDVDRRRISNRSRLPDDFSDEWQFLEHYCGPILLKKHPPVFTAWLRREERIHEEIKDRLRTAGGGAAERKKQVDRQLRAIRRALEICENGK